MRHQSATAHELAQIGLLAGLPGQTLGRLAERMEREQLSPGERLEAHDRFYVVLAGMLSSATGVLRPGDAVADSRTARAITPATVASCDRPTYEELVGPLNAR